MSDLVLKGHHVNFFSSSRAQTPRWKSIVHPCLAPPTTEGPKEEGDTLICRPNPRIGRGFYHALTQSCAGCPMRLLDYTGIMQQVFAA
jgi:hypothetical protein